MTCCEKNQKERIVYMDNIEEFIVDVSNHVENKILNEETLHLSLFEQKYMN